MILKNSYAKWIVNLSILLYVIINLITIKDGHSWGDDFAQYILHAQNIIQGKPYASNIILDPWVVVPPGFPLLLSLLLKCFGLNFVILKLPNVIYWLLANLALYHLIKKRLEKDIARAIFIVLLFSPTFFIFKQNILSDIPFTFFVISSVYLFTQSEKLSNHENFKRKNFLWFLSLFFMGYAFLVRNVGIILFVSLIIYLIVHQKPLKKILTVILLASTLWGLQLSLGMTPTQYSETLSLSLSLKQWWFSLCHNHNINGVFQVIYLFFFSFIEIFSNDWRYVMRWTIFILSPLIFLSLLIIFVQKIRRRTITHWECFSLLYIFSLMLWPLPDERYAYPIVGFVLVSVIETFLRVGKFLLKNINSRSHFDFKKIILGFLALLLLHNVIFVIWAFDFNDNIILKPPNKEMVEWIKTHTKPNEHFMFPKPRVIGLLTGRVGTPLWIFPAQQAQMTERVKKFNIDYLIILKTQDQYLVDSIDHREISVALAWENSAYQIYRVKRIPDPGDPGIRALLN
ncbi:MAG: hypothetical protein A2787_05385 [Omnitrophica WOR_2 bacterium RIFCSPHIGHO2_01_FULL_48_9]|nr:MAG: hypothetical protein A3D10_08065 [Omnitrophica WOR_2 bacterium RIFCSPHIGHO2_02_FULL_48_11]OGX32297.1 MAG: hypothetical protein A2787_05385 [Omnitrophica WOR_2 bacterium RIFCSPHIGHO2_01_FULL_48_9]